MAYFLSGSSCVVFCPPDEYGLVTSLKCLSCVTGCNTCFGGDSSSCYTCKADIVNGVLTDFFLVYQSTQCSTTCSSNQYGNTTGHTCQLCNINCKTCVNTSTTCLSCGFSSIGANLYLLGSQCLLTCPDSYFASLGINQCVSCHVGCASCFGAGLTQCTKCRT